MRNRKLTAATRRSELTEAWILGIGITVVSAATILTLIRLVTAEQVTGDDVVLAVLLTPVALLTAVVGSARIAWITTGARR